MAELAASLVVGPLVSLLKDKVSSSLLDQYNVMEGMEKQRTILERKLPAILDVMADAEMQASRRGGVKAWPEELKTVAYKANNVFELRFISGQLDALKSVEIAGCPELRSLESSCIIELYVLWLMLFCCERKILYHA